MDKFYRGKTQWPWTSWQQHLCSISDLTVTRPTRWSVVISAERRRVISGSPRLPQMRCGRWVTDKIQHSPFCTETSMLGLATSASLFSRKSKWSWWILETNNPEQRFFFFFFATVFVLSAFWTERIRAQTSVHQALRCHELQVMISDGGSARVFSPA